MDNEEIIILRQALALHKEGKLKEAKEYYEQYLKLKPENIDIWDIYAQLVTILKEYNSAIKAYNIILNLLKTEDYNILYQLSILYCCINDLETALSMALRALKINDSDVNLFLHISSLYKDMNLPDEEAFYLEKVFELTNNELIALKLAITYKNSQKLQKAFYYYNKCLEINDSNVVALCGLALVYVKLEQYTKASELAEKVFAADPNNADVYNVFFLIHMEERELDKAYYDAQKMIELSPNDAVGYGCMAMYYYEAVDYNLALEMYDKALSLCPNDREILYNRACCLSVLRHYDEAEEGIKKLISLYPDHMNGKMILTFNRLIQKKYKEGIGLFFDLLVPGLMSKIKDTNYRFKEKFNEYYKKQWKDEDIKNKTLLVYNNVGLGDFIMFSRYIKYLENNNVNIILESNKNLFGIYTNSFPKVKVVEETDDITHNYDYTSSIMALMYTSKLDFDNIPYPEGWLKVDSSLVQKFSDYEIFKTDKLKIGIFWQGNKKIMKNRFMNISDLEPILKNQDKFEFYSLDIVEKDEKTLSFMKKYNIHDCKNYISSFNDTAAILKQLDLFITIDSSVLHLAGAIGIKTYLLIPCNSEWRWFEDEKETPWYNSVRIFKQKKQTDWKSVVEEVNKALNE